MISENVKRRTAIGAVVAIAIGSIVASSRNEQEPTQQPSPQTQTTNPVLTTTSLVVATTSTTTTSTTTSTTTTTTSRPPRPSPEVMVIEIPVPVETVREVVRRVEVVRKVEVPSTKDRLMLEIANEVIRALEQKLGEVNERLMFALEHIASLEREETPATSSSTTTSTTTTLPLDLPEAPVSGSTGGGGGGSGDDGFEKQQRLNAGFLCEPNGNPNGFFNMTGREGESHGGKTRHGCHHHASRDGYRGFTGFHCHSWHAHGDDEIEEFSEGCLQS